MFGSEYKAKYVNERNKGRVNATIVDKLNDIKYHQLQPRIRELRSCSKNGALPSSPVRSELEALEWVEELLSELYDFGDAY